MRQLLVVLLISLLVALPAGAQDIASAPALDLSPAVLERAFARVPSYATTNTLSTNLISTNAFSSAAQFANIDPGLSRTQKIAYFVTLATAIAGTAYNVKTTREALDLHQSVRTFPAIWQKSDGPEDKGRVTGLVIGTNGGVLALGGLLFKRNNATPALIINSFITSVTLAIGLQNQSVINDCTPETCQR
jgi:hypothetical protein